MADSVRVSGDGSSIYNGITVNTPYESASDKGVKVEDFLQLMIAQLTNQDFMNPADDTQYVTQLAQFATMQSMQELSHYSQTNYVTGLVGKSVTVASMGVGGQVNKDIGIVTSINLSGENYTITVNGKQYELNQIMEISDANSAVSGNELEKANNISLVVQDVSSNSVKFRWDPPVSDEALADTLQYDVYFTEDGTLDFSTLSGVRKGTLDAHSLNTTEYELTGLDPEKTYFINVIVRNKNGDEAIYTSSTIRTKA